MNPDPSGGAAVRLLILPCGHSIGVPTEAPVIGLFGPIRDHEASCERARVTDDSGTGSPSAPDVRVPSPAGPDRGGYLSPDPSRFLP